MRASPVRSLPRYQERAGRQPATRRRPAAHLGRRRVRAYHHRVRRSRAPRSDGRPSPGRRPLSRNAARHGSPERERPQSCMPSAADAWGDARRDWSSRAPQRQAASRRRPSWSGSMRSGPRSTAWRGRSRAPRAAGYGRRPPVQANHDSRRPSVAVIRIRGGLRPWRARQGDRREQADHMRTGRAAAGGRVRASISYCRHFFRLTLRNANGGRHVRRARTRSSCPSAVPTRPMRGRAKQCRPGPAHVPLRVTSRLQEVPPAGRCRSGPWFRTTSRRTGRPVARGNTPPS